MIFVLMVVLFVLVVVYDFDGAGVGAVPEETESVLFVDADAVLSFAVAGELFEVVAALSRASLSKPRCWMLCGRRQRRRFQSASVCLPAKSRITWG